MTNRFPIDDGSLLLKIVRQEQAALSDLYDRYARVLYSFVFKILGSVDEAEEVVLDVFSQVWRTADQYDASRSQVDAWLFMLARSRALDQLRKRQRQVKIVQAAAETVPVIPHSQSLNPEEQLLRQEQRDLITEALAELPDVQREVLELAYYKGLTYAEIATQTGKSLGTVKTRLRLALNKLRRRLKHPSV